MMLPAMNSPTPTTGITGTPLKRGDMLLFHGRMATVLELSNIPGRARTVEVTDGGGRTRVFFTFTGSPISYFPSVLDALAAAGDFPKDNLDKRALRAELWFTDPQVGDVFAAYYGVYFLKITESSEGKLTSQVRTSSLVGRDLSPKWETSQHVFGSIEAFQKTFERQDGPGYSLYAWSSPRTKDADRIESLGSIGEAQ